MTRLAGLRGDRAVLDCVFLTSLTVAFALSGVALLWRLIRAPAGDLAWTVAGIGLAYWIGATLLDRGAGRTVMIAGTVAMQAASMPALAWVWHLAGGIDNPGFLWVFAPVLLGDALLLPGWCPYGIVAASWVSVTTVALSESEGLRWLAFRMGLPLAELGDLLRLRRDSQAFSGLSTTPTQTAVTLLLFAGASLTLVCVADSLSRGRGVGSWLESPHASGEPVASVFRQAVETDPLPRVIVRPDNGDIVHMSRSFRRQMLVDAPTANLFDVVRFAEPSDTRLLLSEDEAEVLRCRYIIGPESRVGRLRAHRILRGIEPLVVVTFEQLLLAQSGPSTATDADPPTGRLSC